MLWLDGKGVVNLQLISTGVAEDTMIIMMMVTMIMVIIIIIIIVLLGQKGFLKTVQNEKNLVSRKTRPAGDRADIRKIIAECR